MTLRIAYFTTHLPYPENNRKIIQDKSGYARGGASRVALELASAMAKRGHEVTVFTTSVDSHNDIENYDGLTIYRYGTKFTIGGGRVSFDILRQPLLYNADIVHTHFSTPIADLAGLRYARKKNLPMVISHQSDLDARYTQPINRIPLLVYRKIFVDKVYSYASVITCPSEYSLNNSPLLRRYRDKVALIPHGINIAEFALPYSKEECRERLGLPRESNIILFVGAFEPRKRPYILLQAMPRIISECPDSRLVLLGDGILRNKLEELSRELGISKQIEFAGWISNSFQKSLYYNAADVLVFPSVFDGLTVTLLEASAAGLPIIVSDLPEPRQILTHGENAIVVNRDDISGFANAVIHSLQNPELRTTFAAKGKEKVKDYAWEKIADQMESVYFSLVSER